MINYTDQKNVQVLIALLKEHSIKKIIASPGSANSPFVGSLQQDPYFEMYSSVDERSAAYMACGLAAESGAPVVISCTGATASRNYLPGLTEAFYRKLPVLAVTSTQPVSKVGHHIAQVIDRSSIPKDVAKISVTLPIVNDEHDFWECEILVNRCILELKRHGGGPVHINLPTKTIRNFNAMQLPKVKVIERVSITSKFPELPKTYKVAVFLGSHIVMSNELAEALDRFCYANNSVVFCDHTSNYKGKYRILYSLVAGQEMFDSSLVSPDILIHIGEITGDYYTPKIKGKQVWRVSEDGEIRDTFQSLRYVFEMDVKHFFEHYSLGNTSNKDSYFQFCKKQYEILYDKIPNLPFSNIWIASKIAHRIPDEATIHFGILNSLRSWNFFEIRSTVFAASNVGGFGIDGGVSSLIGASLANRSKLYFGIIGDLAFFYDINALGNRHVGNNIRLLLVNNGKGTEFRLYTHDASHLGEDGNDFIAAAGHFGNKSPVLVKHFAQDLGFEYICASNKKQFEEVFERFLVNEITDKPILFEVFTNDSDESEALEKILSIESNLKIRTKKLAQQVLGNNTISALKKIVK